MCSAVNGFCVQNVRAVCNTSFLFSVSLCLSLDLTLCLWLVLIDPLSLQLGVEKVKDRRCADSGSSLLARELKRLSRLVRSNLVIASLYRITYIQWLPCPSRLAVCVRRPTSVASGVGTRNLLNRSHTFKVSSGFIWYNWICYMFVEGP